MQADGQAVKAAAGPHPPLPAIGALMAGVTLLMTANGMMASLTGLRATSESFADALVGLLGTMYFVGFFVGASVGGGRARAVGYVRSFAGLISLASSAVLIQALVIHPAVWLAARTIYGVCIGGLLVVIESWLNRSADPATRGRTVARYLVATTVGWIVGQVLIVGVGPASARPFLVVALLFSLAAVPALLARTPEPGPETASALPLVALLRASPVAVAASSVAGATWGAVGMVGAVHAESLGFAPGQVAAFVAAFLVGQGLAAAPIGALADRMDRRVLVLRLLVVAAIAAGAGGLVGPRVASTLLVALVFGAAAFPLYGLALAIVGDLLSQESSVSAATSLVRVNAIAAGIAPAAVAVSGGGFFPVLLGMTVAALVVTATVVARSGPLLPRTVVGLLPARASAALSAGQARVARRRRDSVRSP